MRMEVQRQEKKKAREREGGCGDERRASKAGEERWINALCELCKRGAWVIENKLCVCVKEAEKWQGEQEREENEGGKEGDSERWRE